MDESSESERAEIYAKRVRAGKRTYFFDVKSTRASDYYLTITESMRRYQGEGYTYEKHKIFLYKEDFAKFVEALSEALDHIKLELMPEVDFAQFDKPYESRLEGPDSRRDAPTTLPPNDSDLRWE